MLIKLEKLCLEDVIKKLFKSKYNNRTLSIYHKNCIYDVNIKITHSTIGVNKKDLVRDNDNIIELV